MNPELPFPFLSIGCKKAHIGVYHMGIYAEPQLLTGSRLNIPSTVLPDWTWARAASVYATPDRSPWSFWVNWYPGCLLPSGFVSQKPHCTVGRRREGT